MSNSKKIFLMISSLVISGLLLLSSNNKPAVSTYQSRKLSLTNEDRSKIDEICRKSKASINNYFLEGMVPKGLMEIEENQKESDDVKIIIGLFEGNANSSDLINYAMKALVWIVFIVFGILVIPGYFFCCCCCCCPCCCCKQTQKHQYLCKLISFIIFATMFAVVIGISIYGFFGLNSILKGFNGTTCAVMKFYLEFAEGQAKEEKPKWSGISGVQEILSNLTDAIDDISTGSAQTSKDKEDVEKLGTAYDTLIDSSYTEVKNLKIEYTDPKSNSKTNFSPVYVTNYGDKDKANSPLNFFNTEYSQVLKAGKNLVDQTADAGKEISSQADGAKNSIGGLSDTITGFESTFDSFSDTVISNWLSYQDTINYYGDLGFKIFFGIFLGIGALIAGFTVVFVILGIRIFKLFIHIFWSILMLITIFTFIFGAIFGLFGTIGKTATEMMIYVISDENLGKGDQAALLPGSTTQYLSVCLTGDGNLSKMFNLGSLGTNLDKLNELQSELELVIDTLEKNKDSKVYPNIKTNYDNYRTHYIVPPTNDNQIYAVLQDCNNLKECNDKWAIDKEDCDDSTYVAKANKKNSCNGECLVFRDWKDSDSEIDTLYNGKEEVKEKVKKCVKAFVEIEETNNEIIGKIQEKNIKLNENYSSTVAELKSKVENSKKILDPVKSVFGDLLGENSSVFSVINCSFLGTHINLVITELHNALGTGFYNFGIIVETLSMASVLGVIFLIPVLNRFHKNFDDPKKGKGKQEDAKGLNTTGNQLVNTEVLEIHKKPTKILEGGKVVIQK